MRCADARAEFERRSSECGVDYLRDAWRRQIVRDRVLVVFVVNDVDVVDHPGKADAVFRDRAAEGDEVLPVAAVEPAFEWGGRQRPTRLQDVLEHAEAER